MEFGALMRVDQAKEAVPAPVKAKKVETTEDESEGDESVEE
jgi:hypothetical protein